MSATPLRELARPGDVINWVGHGGFPSRDWWVQSGIKILQRFASPSGFWKSTHTTFYFDDEHILSVTYPKAVWITIDEAEQHDWRLLRPRFTKFTNDDLIWMEDWAERYIIGTDYDIVELLSHLVREVYPAADTVVSDINKLTANIYVCSSGVRAMIEARRKHVENEVCVEPYPRLFTSNGEKLLLERTRPEHYDCMKDFRLVATKI